MIVQFVCKKRKRIYKAARFHSDGQERNKSQVVYSEEHAALFLKMFFLRNSFSLVKNLKEINSMPSIDFIEWLSSSKGGSFCWSSFHIYVLLGTSCTCTLMCPCGVILF